MQDISLLVPEKRMESGFAGLSPSEFTLPAFQLLLSYIGQTLAPFESTYQGELWNITTVESMVSSSLSSTPTSRISIGASTADPFPTTDAPSPAVGQANIVPMAVGLGVGLGVPAIAAIVFLVVYFANRRFGRRRGSVMNPAFDPSLSSAANSGWERK